MIEIVGNRQSHLEQVSLLRSRAASKRCDAIIDQIAIAHKTALRGRVQYSWIRPHQFSQGLVQAVAEEKLNIVRGMG